MPSKRSTRPAKRKVSPWRQLLEEIFLDLARAPARRAARPSAACRGRTLSIGASTIVPTFSRYCWAIARIGDAPEALLGTVLAPPDAGVALVGAERVAAGGDEIDAALEGLPGKLAVGLRRGDLVVERERVERLRDRHAEDVLAEHVERAGAERRRVLVAEIVGVERGAALQHLEAVGRHQDALRRLVDAMVGAADALRQAARALRRADMDDEVDVAPVDAEVERRGRRPRRGAFPPPSPPRPFGAACGRASRGAGRSAARPRWLPELLEEQLRLPAGVDEEERRLVPADRGVDLGQRVACGVALPGNARFSGSRIEMSGCGAAFHDHAVGEVARPRPATCGTSQAQRSSGSATVAERPIVSRPGESWRSRARPSDRRSPRFDDDERMELVEDDAAEAAEEAPRVARGDQQRHLLGRGQKNVRRVGLLALALVHRRVAGSRLQPDRQAHLGDRRARGCARCRPRAPSGARRRACAARRTARRAAIGPRSASSTRLGRKPARVFPAPVGAMSRADRAARAFSSSATWCGRGDQPRRANQAAKGAGRSGVAAGCGGKCGHKNRGRTAILRSRVERASRAVALRVTNHPISSAMRPSDLLCASPPDSIARPAISTSIR